MIGNWLTRRRWRRSSKLTHGERLVIDILLSGPGSALRGLAMQVEKAVSFEREMVGSTAYTLRIPWTTEDLLIGTDEDMESVPAYVTDVASGRELRFKLQVKRGGFWGPLIGEAVDGASWPLTWSVAGPSAVRVTGTPPFLALPSERARRAESASGIEALAVWLRQPLDESERARLRMRPPATDEQLARLMEQVAGNPSTSLIAFLRITNGLDIAGLELLGTRDTYRLVIQDRPLLVIASLDGEGVIAIPLDDGEEVLLCQASSDGTAVVRQLAPDMATFVRQALEQPRDVSG